MSATNDEAAAAAAAAATQAMQKIIAEVPVVLFSSSTCKDSAAVKRLLLQCPSIIAPALQVVEVNVLCGGSSFPESAQRSALSSISGASTTPQLFLQGKAVSAEEMHSMQTAAAAGGHAQLEKRMQEACAAYEAKKTQSAGEQPAAASSSASSGASSPPPSHSHGQSSLLTVCTRKSYASVCASLPLVAPLFRYGVLHSYNLMQLLQSKGQASFKTETSVFDVCNPGHACSVLSRHPAVSTALPCRISVWYDEAAGLTVIQSIAPAAIIVSMFQAEDLKDVAHTVEADLVTIMMQIM